MPILYHMEPLISGSFVRLGISHMVNLQKVVKCGIIKRYTMKIRNNYDECLTNLACSVQKYFGVKPKHKTLKSVDKILKEKQPKNVVVILLDGMGANIMERALPETAFFRENLVKPITTVFPATTTAATTSIRSGLNPVEHGWLGWTTYIEPIDKVITLFAESEKGQERVCPEFLTVKDQLAYETVAEQVENVAGAHGVEIGPFFEIKYNSFDGMLAKIRQEIAGPEKCYVYAYDEEPDATMHEKGPDSGDARELIVEKNFKIAQFAEELHDTLLIVVADHGHKKVKNVALSRHPEILDLLERKTSIDQRAVSFKVKPGKKGEFKKLFKKEFGEDYKLYDAKDVIKSKLFGDCKRGAEHPFFEAAVGDFVAIAVGETCLNAPEDEVLVSHHAGWTDDEIFVPLIMKYCE